MKERDIRAVCLSQLSVRRKANPLMNLTTSSLSLLFILPRNKSFNFNHSALNKLLQYSSLFCTNELYV
ncbi:hypothetical protein T07_7487 [Trichinella nelsoni]|uniref:Uncharacterized protein n=1 Tax=Trichinella nelsoni TaxID=6336 RepID=A0A0V0RUM4_9BILA|nr:hypothetical protein T07_7487 [Trichinella nelsoni]